MATRVYQYGLQPPTENADLVRSQMRLGYQYRNVLIEIERARRAAIRDVLHAAVPSLSALEDSWKSADDECCRIAVAIKAVFVASRSRKPPADLIAQLTDAKATRSAVQLALSKARSGAFELESVTAECKRLGDLAKDLQHSASEISGVYWGTKQIHEGAYRQSSKMPLWDNIYPNDPSHVHWDGSGSIGVQLQNGRSVQEFFEENRLLYAEPVDPIAWNLEKGSDGQSLTSRSARRKLAHTFLRARVGSDDRDPVFAKFEMIMHRALPAGARVKVASISCNRVGPSEQWTVQITVDLPDDTKPTCGAGAVAIDVGWRQFGEEIRYAAWHDDQGRSGDMRLSPKILGAIRKADDLQKIRKDNFNAARKALSLALPALKLPEWFLKEARLATLDQWLSPARLRAFAELWKEVSFPGDEEAYAALEAWRYNDWHLWEWECNQRQQALLQRREAYRMAARWLATTYETVVIEKFKLDPFVRRADVDEEEQHERVRRHRHMVAISEFRTVLEHAIARARGEQKEKNPAYSTRECNACHSIETFDAARQVTHTCSVCETPWDQDDNAAINLLGRYKRDVESKEFVAQPGPVTHHGSRRFKKKEKKPRA